MHDASPTLEGIGTWQIQNGGNVDRSTGSLHSCSLSRTSCSRFARVLANSSRILAKRNARPANVASSAFHVRHITGVIDRLFTYARGEALSPEQLASIPLEGAHLAISDVAATLGALSARVDAAIDELRKVDISTLAEFRGVGRAQLPSSVIGCLVRGAEHSMRH